MRDCLVLKAKEGSTVLGKLSSCFSSLHHFVQLSSTVMFPTFLFMGITSEGEVSMAAVFLR